MTQRYEEKIRRMIIFCRSLSDLSTCKRYPTSAIVFPADCTSVYSIGYNGVPTKLPNDMCTGTQGGCGCIHAEANALLKLREQFGAIMYCTVAPCLQCAGLILNSMRIRLVIYGQMYRNELGVDRLRQAHLPIVSEKGIDYDMLRKWR